MNKKLVFVTGTRADFGKLKPLIAIAQNNRNLETSIFVTGMHLLSRYGSTIDEIFKSGFKNIYSYINQIYGEPMDMILANTIHGLAKYVHEFQPDMIVVHGDRVETLAGAIVGSLRNTLVAHVEGGELSVTVDGLIRHSVSKLAHLHLVANEEAEKRLIQLGEHPQSIFVIGSPEVDTMLSNQLPGINEVKKHYNINFEKYSIVALHPVTTEINHMRQYAEQLVSALLQSNGNYILIYPNNDAGSDAIFQAYESIKNKSNFKIFPSFRFEYFLTLLKHAKCLIGNSSAGVRECPIFGVPSINIGTRQQGRFQYPSILCADYSTESILHHIQKAQTMDLQMPSFHFGKGNSAKLFDKFLHNEEIWRVKVQKTFYSL